MWLGAGHVAPAQDRATTMVTEASNAAIELDAASREGGLGKLGPAVLSAFGIG